MNFHERGARVRIVNPKHKHNGRSGVVTDLNRGNVTVRLDDGTVVVTRMVALRGPTGLERLADLAPTWVPANGCPHCGEAAHVYFCLRDPRYLADPVGFPQSAAATTPKATA